MNLDITRSFGVVIREVASEMREGKLARVVVASRSYDTTIDDLWDAVTNARRIPRWFLPVTGELKLGGRYQLEGNAGGTITACRAPEFFASTWEMFGDVSWVEVTLAAADGRTNLQLRHIAHVDDDRWKQYGPGAVGVGWDLGMLGLQLHLESGDTVDPQSFEAWTMSDEGKRFLRLASNDWGRASTAAGTDPEEASAAAEGTYGFYSGETPMDEEQPAES